MTRLELGYDGDDFIRNLRTILWRGRGALVVPADLFSYLVELWSIGGEPLPEHPGLWQVRRNDPSEPDRHKIDDSVARDIIKLFDGHHTERSGSTVVLSVSSPDPTGK